MWYIVIAAGWFLLDFFTKKKVERQYKEGETKALYKDWICLEKVYNPGAAMGLFGKSKKLLITLTVTVISFFVVTFPGVLKKKSKTVKFAYACILGGACNNAYDRIKKGNVTDYIRFPKLPGKLKQIVFNISDFVIFAGIMLLAVSKWKRSPK